MLKEITVFERAVAREHQRSFDLHVEAINQHDADSKRALADLQELYASAEARASAVIKQEEDLDVCVHQVNQRAWDVEELEGKPLEQEELDGITLRHELEVLSTRESTLEHREVNLDREQKALEDARAQVLAHELDTDSREAGLRDQEAILAVWEQQMQELVVA
jgi:uncharacterized protein (DUF3084 family)